MSKFTRRKLQVTQIDLQHPLTTTDDNEFAIGNPVYKSGSSITFHHHEDISHSLLQSVTVHQLSNLSRVSRFLQSGQRIISIARRHHSAVCRRDDRERHPRRISPPALTLSASGSIGGSISLLPHNCRQPSRRPRKSKKSSSNSKQCSETVRAPGLRRLLMWKLAWPSSRWPANCHQSTTVK